MPIVPDTKDWTWVVERRCPECGFDASAIAPTEVPALIRQNAAAWGEVLAGSQPLRQRPAEDRWSALEYACHVRDVFSLYDTRLGLMLTEDDPAYPNWDQDVAAVEERYNGQDPAVVARDLQEGADHLADDLDRVQGEQWSRTGTRSDGAHFTVDTFARYMIHDPIHHLHDVRQGLARIAQAD